MGAAGRDTCQACAHGSVALELGLTACTLCGASTWQNTSSAGHLARACEACPANSSHALAGVTDVFACLCAPGVYKLPLDFASETFRCALCEPGARCPGEDRIEDCPFNTFTVGGVVTECTPCAEHSSAATSAPLASPEQCQCVQGAEEDFHEHCALCAPGKFQPIDLTFNSTGHTGDRSAVATVCQPCAVNQFQTQSGATACVACHANSSSGAGSDAAEDCTCDAGFVGLDGDVCRLCEPGRFCPGGEVSVQCRLFSFSAPGDSQEAQCSCVAGYYSTNDTAPCLKCLPGAWCAGGLGYVPCANASSRGAHRRRVLLRAGLLTRLHAHQEQRRARRWLRRRGRAAVRAVGPQRRLRQRHAAALPGTQPCASRQRRRARLRLRGGIPRGILLKYMPFQ